MPASAPFVPDPAFADGSHAAAQWGLRHVPLQDDARLAWLVLIPRVAGAVELEGLSPDQRAALMAEIVRAGEHVRGLGRLLGRPVEKLNVGALGNVTAQLHVHVVGRRCGDACWPDPVWGRGAAEPWPADLREEALARLA